MLYCCGRTELFRPLLFLGQSVEISSYLFAFLISRGLPVDELRWIKQRGDFFTGTLMSYMCLMNAFSKKTALEEKGQYVPKAHFRNRNEPMLCTGCITFMLA